MAEINTYKGDILQIFNENLPWEDLSGSNILVTGATGLIAGCLVKALLINPKRNYRVFAMGRNMDRAKKLYDEYNDDTNFSFIQHDVTQPLESNTDFDYIIHAASGANPMAFATQPVEVIKANIDGVAQLMNYGLKHHMRRFLYVSSGEVYGEGDGRVFTEDYSGYVNPTTLRASYPSSKRAAESLCIAYAAEYGVDVVIARPCHIYGPQFSEQDNRVYAQFIRNILNGENIIMKSSGEQFRSWCYVVDCVSALFFILLKGKNGNAYNIADDKSNITIKELAEMIAIIGHKKVLFEEPEINEKKGFNPVSKSVYSTEKIRELGWMCRNQMIDNLQKTIIESQL